jgi:endonuclease YncB( thermonuclease family)
VGAKSGFSVVVAIWCGLLAVGCSRETSAPTSTLQQPRGESAVVAYVNDGDTLRTTDGRRIRLVQIDAPELHGDCYGKAALAALRRLAPAGVHVMLVADPALDAVDRYGRRLRYVFAGGRNVNLALVRAGAASPYFFRGVRGRYAPDLLDAAREARDAKRGYWSACPQAQLDTRRGSVTGEG